MRTIIEVPDDDIKNLDRIVEQQKKSRAAIIREAIRLYLEGKSVGSSKAAFGIWKGKKAEGIEYQTEVRSEWV